MFDKSLYRLASRFFFIIFAERRARKAGIHECRRGPPCICIIPYHIMMHAWDRTHSQGRQCSQAMEGWTWKQSNHLSLKKAVTHGWPCLVRPVWWQFPQFTVHLRVFWLSVELWYKIRAAFRPTRHVKQSKDTDKWICLGRLLYGTYLAALQTSIKVMGCSGFGKHW